MGRHADAGRSRGVARWVITAAAVVIVLAAVTVIYVVVVNRSDRAVDGVCAGKVSLSVLTGPGAKPALAAAADAYNRTGPVARSSCVTATTSAAADADALTALSDPSKKWPSGLGPAPGMWVPDNAAALAALDDVQPAVAAGHPTDPFAWSPVVLAVRTADVPAVSDLTWSNLPAAAGPTGTAALPGARHLLLALPPVDANRATSYAAQSLLAGTDRSDALDVSAVQSQSSVLTALGAGAAGTAATTAAALTSLGSGSNQAAGSATAVPVVEADLAAFDTSGHDLAAVHPAGPTVGDSLITAPITAGWTDPTVAAAASSFQAYLSSKPGQQILADHGWRTDSVHPSDPIAGVDTTASVRRLPAGSPAVDAAVAAGLGQPAPATPSGIASSPPASTPVTSTSASVTSSGTASNGTPTGTGSTRTSPSTSSSSTGRSSSTATTTTTSSTTASSDPAARGPVLTIIVDASADMSATQDGKTLLDWAKKAAGSITDGSVTDHAGLWAYSDSGFLPPDGYPELVSTGALSGKVDGKTRAEALRSALGNLKAGGDRWAYGALIQALTKAPGAAVDGRQSRILLITSGVDETPATPRQSVLDAEDAVGSKVRIDVIGLGTAVPADAYQEIASTGGGKYVPVTDPSKLGQTITDLLTLEG